MNLKLRRDSLEKGTNPAFSVDCQMRSTGSQNLPEWWHCSQSSQEEKARGLRLVRAKGMLQGGVATSWPLETEKAPKPGLGVLVEKGS